MNTIYRYSTRREFLANSAKVILAGAACAATPRAFSSGPIATLPRGRAGHCIFLWLGGGVSQIDTWDPKAVSPQKGVKPGAYYESIDTAVRGVRVSEHLPRCASLMERMSLVRTVSHDMKAEHGAATVRVHTGRPTTGTIRYPSIGSIIAHERGPLMDSAPAYVVIGLPSAARDPGFLGAHAGYLYVTNTESGPASLQRHNDVDNARQLRRESLLAELRRSAPADPIVSAYDGVISQSLKLAGSEFMSAFDLTREPGDLRLSYGGEFGQRCLLARRMIERGVRFVEVSHNLNFVNGTGWDTHDAGQLKQHILIHELDHALATLLRDLEARRLIDKTLVVVGTEFGRPGSFDSGGGRGHHPDAFTVVFAGGGLQHGQVVGVTDDLAEQVVERPVSVPDFLATICAGLGVDPEKELHTTDGRPVPATDGGRPLRELFS